MLRAKTKFRPEKLMDTLGIEPRPSRMLSGCDTTTPCALLSARFGRFLGFAGPQAARARGASVLPDRMIANAIRDLAIRSRAGQTVARTRELWNSLSDCEASAFQELARMRALYHPERLRRAKFGFPGPRKGWQWSCFATEPALVRASVGRKSGAGITDTTNIHNAIAARMNARLSAKPYSWLHVHQL